MSYLMSFCSCVFFSPFSIAITPLGEERANLGAFRTFVWFVLVWICRFVRSRWITLLTVLRRGPGVSLALCCLWYIQRDDLFYVLPCVIFFLCFLVLALRLPRLGKRELILVLFVRLFDLCLFGFVGFLFLLVSGKGCGLWLWHSLDLISYLLQRHVYSNILKILPQKNENFQKKKKKILIFFIFLLKTDCWYSLELLWWGGSNEYPQSMFWA